jgi:DNA-binding LytR/AlgR family response regulator
MERIAICDNDTNSIKVLREQIERFAHNLNMDISIATYASGDNLLFYWASPKMQTDILYLNVDLSGTAGIAVAEELRKMGCHSEIIFYTNSADEVFEAFDVEAFHYILKNDTPIEKQEEIFRKAILKSHEQVEEVLTFSHYGEHVTIKKRSIKYFTVDLKIITVHYEEGKTFDFISTMDKISNMLVSKGFLRVNRGMLINMEHVDNRTKTEVIMKDGERFGIGKRYRALAQKEFAYYLRETDKR